MVRGSTLLGNKWMLRTTGYCRSGNTFLNYALKCLYYNEESVNLNWHTVAKLDAREKIIVPFRNPLDCISSWHLYPSSYSLDADIKYYLRFYAAVLEKVNKVVLMDFDYFTKDIDYIKNKVFKNFGIETDRYVTDTQVKEAMFANNKYINLPRGNQEELNVIKKQLVNQPLFEKCVELFNQLKNK